MGLISTKVRSRFGHEEHSYRPNPIILDVMLPDIDGFEVAKRLAAPGSEVVSLFLTARDRTEDKIRIPTVGGVD